MRREQLPNRQSGFTLMEILVALFIFAVVGLISAQLLGRTVNAYEVLDDRGQRLGQIHRAMLVVERDMLQFRNRPIRMAQGEPLPALMIGDEGALSMTRGGWRNPLQRPRSELQRVGYRMQDEKLVRGYWSVLDRRGDEEPISQTLLEGVEELEFFAIDQNGEEHKFWPPKAGQGAGQLQIAGLVLRVSMVPLGIVERVWEVPSG
ncbi:MAG: type II secretion system protein GspJ [Gammaproteobacteria bacterium]|jgi:general secretion pathway protein J|nr:type II secretion system protein GspJ [Gammaproteobacteria bacterium]MAI11234.1 type II secretion system protein GspJ [Rhodospirillaceae bacterium]MBP73983.1 type II secretion system protein GspJ [Gammaproteobacteria bacterium]HBX00979.1 type II secretion system protein GspJ [Gammaproteobacteria bacterium]|tara:strand:+ start:1138 stop:1752 length:615 start_codon:yes stop_codon:yes gene_type:complete